MSEKSQVIAEVQAAYRELQQAVEGIPDDKMAVPWAGEWSAKDILAHTASWDEFASVDLQRIGRGHMPCLAAFREAEVDDWNAFFMKSRKLFPLPQVRFESEHWHRQVVETLEGLPETLFAQGQMVANFAAIMAGHYRQHAQDIRQWRQKEGI